MEFDSVFKTWADLYSATRSESGDKSTFSIVATRIESDRLAAWLKWHEKDFDNVWEPVEFIWYRVLEQSRVDTLASHDLPGIARNLSNSHSVYREPKFQALYRASRAVFDSKDCTHVRFLAEELNRSKKVGLLGIFQRNSVRISESFLEKSLVAASDTIRNAGKFSLFVRPLVVELSKIEFYTGHSDYLEQERSLSLPFNSHPDSRDSSYLDQSTTDFAEADESTLETVNSAKKYRIFDTSLDLICHARDLLLISDKKNLANNLVNISDNAAKRSAKKFFARLQQKTRSSWLFDQEEGRIDSKKLSRLINPQGQINVFRHENRDLEPFARVSFLLDLSGSISGKRAQLSGSALDFAVRVLEACNIEVEVLGFTTEFQEENPIEVQWRKSGSNSKPGRLNATKHIVLKAPGQRWRLSRMGLALLFRDDIAKENIDGEAVRWAISRMIHSSANRKVLIAFSDGQPFDQATVDANGPQLLEDDLRDSIRQGELSGVRICAVGPSSDITRFYSHSVVLREIVDYGEALMETLSSALDLTNKDVMRK